MDWLVKGFPHLVLYVFGGLLLALVPVLFCLLLKRAGVLDRFSEATHWLSTRSRLEQMFIVCFVIVFIVVGSVKPGGGSTNDLGRASLPRLARGLPVGDVILPVDVVRGWRVAGTDGNGPVDMPAGAVTNDLLRRRGGHDWAFRVEPEGFRAPCRDGFIEGVTVFARGEVRPDVGTLYYPVPLTNGVSLLPEARWGMLSHAEAQRRGEGSVFSHAVTTNGSLLLDWRNALVGRDPNSPTNLQMELFADGGFVWRTDGGSTSYLPVLPFDWDGDGLENSVDPEPLVPNSVDAHGTPPEWYRIVCSNVFDIADDPNIPTFKHSNINSNAYYFVDVVASQGPAPIWFNADRDSRLDSPVVVAWGGETNRVPLLIGVEYAVTSTVPFTVSLPEDGFAETNRQNGCSVTVKWPLDFAFVEDADAPGAYTVEVVPYDPGVAFTWNSPVPGGGVSLLSAAPPSASSCSCWSGSGPSVVFDCSDNCDCGGGCQASGTGGLEDAEFAVTGGVCRCSRPDEPHEDEPPPPPDPLVGGLSVSFSKGAVIFEDEYRNTENGPLVPRRSTTTRLTVSASGGPLGGSFTLTTRNLEKLAVIGGSGPIALPTSKSLEPFETYSATFECEGTEASDSEGDVEVSGVFVGGVTASVESHSDSTTVVKVELEVEDRPPQNPVPNRHIYGLCEKVYCRSHPSGVDLKWNSADKKIFMEDGDFLRCPWTGGVYDVSATLDGARLDVPMRVYEPTIECRSAMWRDELVGQPGAAGMVGMTLALYLQPSTVSFANIWMEEIPEYIAVPQSGYFTAFPGLVPLTHDVGAGAGVWRQPVMTANGNYWCDDAAQMPSECPPLPGTDPPAWSEGTVRWMIPVGWGDRAVVIGGILPNPTDQVYRMRDDGTLSISKYTHVIMRSVDDRIWLDGNRVNAWWNGLFQ